MRVSVGEPVGVVTVSADEYVGVVKVSGAELLV